MAKGKENPDQIVKKPPWKNWNKMNQNAKTKVLEQYPKVPRNPP